MCRLLNHVIATLWKTMVQGCVHGEGVVRCMGVHMVNMECQITVFLVFVSDCSSSPKCLGASGEFFVVKLSRASQPCGLNETGPSAPSGGPQLNFNVFMRVFVMDYFGVPPQSFSPRTPTPQLVKK